MKPHTICFIGNSKAIMESVGMELDVKTAKSRIKLYDLNFFDSGSELLRFLKNVSAAAVITEFQTYADGMDIVKLISRIKEDYPYIQIIAIVGNDTVEKAAMVNAGCLDLCVFKPILPGQILSAVKQAVDLGYLKTQMVSWEQLTDLLIFTLRKKDPFTTSHQYRVAKLSVKIAREIGLSESMIKRIYLSGLLHDLGKLFIPTELLMRPGCLSSAEMSLVRQHPQLGFDIVKEISFAAPIAQVVLQHHERLDGSGYPLGIKGDDILLETRILSVSDVVEAMSSHRPYRPALGIDCALNEISSNKGKLYDSDVVDICCDVFEKKNFRFYC